MKRVVSLLLVLVTLASISILFTGCIQDKCYYDDGDYTFYAMEDSEHDFIFKFEVRNKAITSAEFPETYKGMPVVGLLAGAFEECTQLTSVIIPTEYTSIPGGCFENCTNLTEVNLHDNITEVGIGAFQGCSSLVNIELPNGITELNDRTFGLCSSLEKVILPNGLKSIGEEAFCYCTSLKEINIPEGVTRIGIYAFGYTGLTSITIPASVTSLGEDFSYCENLKIIYFGGTVEQWQTFAPRNISVPVVCTNGTIEPAE